MWGMLVHFSNSSMGQPLEIITITFSGVEIENCIEALRYLLNA